MYDRAIVLEKGRAAKTNFPITEYDKEIAAFQLFCTQRCACPVVQLFCIQAEESTLYLGQGLCLYTLFISPCYCAVRRKQL